MNATREWQVTETASYSLLEDRTQTAYHVALPDGRKVLCPDHATANIIVRAVNSYDAMREALQLIVAWNRSGGASSLEEARELTYRKSQAALALAKGEVRS